MQRTETEILSPVFLERREATRRDMERPLAAMPELQKALEDFSHGAEGFFYMCGREAAKAREMQVARFMPEAGSLLPLIAENSDEFVVTVGHQERNPYIAPSILFHVEGDWGGFPIALAAIGRVNPTLDIYRIQRTNDGSIDRLAGVSLQKQQSSTRRSSQQESPIATSLLSFGEQGAKRTLTPVVYGREDVFSRLHRAVISAREELVRKEVLLGVVRLEEHLV